MPDPYPAPHGATARRLEWPFLPANLRAYIERKCGSPVVEAISQTSGFTPGFASVLVCEDGSRHFVKAASVKAQRLFADSYREEARKLAALPASVPAPRLLWHLDDDWVVLGIEYVAARAPHRPWQPADLDALLDALETCADALTPPPTRWSSTPRRTTSRRCWTAGPASARPAPTSIPRTWPRPRPWPAATPRCARGDTLVHTDIRSDNVLIDADGPRPDLRLELAGARRLVVRLLRRPDRAAR